MNLKSENPTSAPASGAMTTADLLRSFLQAIKDRNLDRVKATAAILSEWRRGCRVADCCGLQVDGPHQLWNEVHTAPMDGPPITGFETFRQADFEDFVRHFLANEQQIEADIQQMERDTPGLREFENLESGAQARRILEGRSPMIPRPLMELEDLQYLALVEMPFIGRENRFRAKAKSDFAPAGELCDVA